MSETTQDTFHWRCQHTWRQSAKNTLWCLVGCSVGDFGTILWFQFYSPDSPPLLILTLAIVNGLATSVMLETYILSRQMTLGVAFKTAVGMSFVSMIAMEIAMNATDYALVGKAAMTWWSVAPSLLAGFVTPWPYNYWRLKKHGQACH